MTTPTNYCLSGTLDTLLSETSFVPGVVAAVADRNGLLYAGAAGVRDTDTGIAMDTKTIIAIASMTKAITTTALYSVLLCVEYVLLSLWA
ncbi:MAG: serine hydrolase domain-containing protein [Pseudomonadales bacterium]|nr:serine hydrolase domain-containing protein [Pseudomonadales bacterium]